MKVVQISDFKLGHSMYGFYMCRDKSIRHTRGGDLYLDMVFSDSTGSVYAKLWDFFDNFQNRFDIGDPVAVKGTVTEFNGYIQLTVHQINKATDRQYGKYGFSLSLLQKTIDEPINMLWGKLILIIKSLSHPYKALIWDIFRDNENKIKYMPNSVDYNESYRGSFLKHITTVLEQSIKMLDHYPKLEKDLVLCGILISDIGKVKSFNDDVQVAFTNAGKMISHTVLGVEILHKYARLIKKFPRNILLKLEHIIISNEFGVKLEKWQTSLLPEALLVHYLNSMNRNINIVLDTLERDPNVEWSEIHKYYQKELLKK